MALLAILMGFIEDLYESPSLYMTNTDLMEHRARNVLNYAFIGYGITFDAAMDIINKKDISELSVQQIEERDMLINMVDNLINFAVVEEHQALEEIKADKEDSENYEEFVTLATGTFAKYNKTYAFMENSDILFALGIAAKWVNYDTNQIIEYKTQGDERVRDSHQALDGLRYRKKDFPAALVPPIAHGCRCYTINTGWTDGRKLTNKNNVDDLIKAAGDSTFKYNVATSGIMFSEDHPYFAVSNENSHILKNTVRKIKRRIGI